MAEEQKQEPEKQQNDDELIALLGSFSKKQTVPLDAAPPPKIVAQKPKKPAAPPPPPKEAAHDLEPPDDDEDPPKIEKPPIVEPELKPAEKLVKILPPSDLTKADAPDQHGFHALVAKFGPMVDSITGNYKSDRDQIEAAIQYLEGQVKGAPAGARGSGVFVEAWANLLIAKSDINTNATKVLDSVAKLLAAGKSNDLIINLSGKVDADDIDLEHLLSKEMPK